MKWTRNKTRSHVWHCPSQVGFWHSRKIFKGAMTIYCIYAGKPRLVLDYNKYKSGVDRLDQVVRCYSYHRKSNRFCRFCSSATSWTLLPATSSTFLPMYTQIFKIVRHTGVGNFSSSLPSRRQVISGCQEFTSSRRSDGCHSTRKMAVLPKKPG